MPAKLCNFGMDRLRPVPLDSDPMSFWLVQIVSVVGVAAVIALTWLVGWGERARIASVEAATARFKADFPAANVKEGVVAKDRRVALLDLGDGLGLVTVLGDELVTRKLDARQFTMKRDGGSLVLELPDPTLARVEIAMADDSAAKFDELTKSVYWGAP